MSEVKDENSAAKTLLLRLARRSFFQGNISTNAAGPKMGKTSSALDTFSNDSIPLFEGK